jgi:hypothetical protein
MTAGLPSESSTEATSGQAVEALTTGAEVVEIIPVYQSKTSQIMDLGIFFKTTS